MGNYNISKAERLFLRENLLRKYCRLVGHSYDEFEEGLTGTLGHYERISDVMADYIDDEKNFPAYIDRIGESSLKIRLKKIVQGRDEDRRKFLRDLRSFASGNVLRKLIFYGADEGDMSFKEDFITACYYYIQTDRVELLRKITSAPSAAQPARGGKAEKGGKAGKADTISPVRPDHGSKGMTIPAWERQRGFTLKFLKDTDEVDETRKTLDFTGETVSLNRDNLQPENNTITGKVQAEIKLVDGEWYIENKSRLKTTFIQVQHPIKLNKGDIIIMGNQRFLFDE